MQTINDKFAAALIDASNAMGSFLDVARFLGVAPKQVFLWVADVELPTEEQCQNIEGRLRSAIASTSAEA